jgi:glycerophosphoryl diester phosphodiesterase
MMKSTNKFLDGSRITLGCHRGDRKNFPENTMSAFRAAVDLGLDAIETDIRMTKDGHLVIMHDRDVARTTNGKGFIDQMTLEELRRLDAGFGRAPST